MPARRGRVLLAGAGGGLDVYATLPIAVALAEVGTEVAVASLSFTGLDALGSEIWLDRGVAVIRPDTPSAFDGYFPERTLACWCEVNGLPPLVYVFPKTGVQPLRAAYRRLIEHLSADAMVLVDGGTDVLLRGDESGLGTPEEDMASLAALAGPVKLAASLGFGIDAFHGVNHTQIPSDPPRSEPAVDGQGDRPARRRALHAQHTAHGMQVVRGGVLAVEPGRMRLTGGGHVAADVIVAGIGITVNTELAEGAGLETDDGVLVDAGMRTSAANVYAIGDIARVAGTPRRSEHWDNARRTAEAAARSLLGLAPRAPSAPWFWTDRYGTHLEMTGHYDPEALAVARGEIEAGSGTVFYVRGTRCVGAVSLHRPLEIRAAQRMIDRRIEVDPTRLADEGTDLRKLLTPRP